MCELNKTVILIISATKMSEDESFEICLSQGSEKESSALSKKQTKHYTYICITTEEYNNLLHYKRKNEGMKYISDLFNISMQKQKRTQSTQTETSDRVNSLEQQNVELMIEKASLQIEINSIRSYSEKWKKLFENAKHMIKQDLKKQINFKETIKDQEQNLFYEQYQYLIKSKAQQNKKESLQKWFKFEQKDITEEKTVEIEIDNQMKHGLIKRVFQLKEENKMVRESLGHAKCLIDEYETLLDTFCTSIVKKQNKVRERRYDIKDKYLHKNGQYAQHKSNQIFTMPENIKLQFKFDSQMTNLHKRWENYMKQDRFQFENSNLSISEKNQVQQSSDQEKDSEPEAHLESEEDSKDGW